MQTYSNFKFLKTNFVRSFNCQGLVDYIFGRNVLQFAHGAESSQYLMFSMLAHFSCNTLNHIMEHMFFKST